MIPAVALQDAGWLLLVLATRAFAPTTWSRKLLGVMAAYVCLELVAHYWMEETVAWTFRALGV